MVEKVEVPLAESFATVTQLAECHPSKLAVVGSNPIRRSNFGPVV